MYETPSTLQGDTTRLPFVDIEGLRDVKLRSNRGSRDLSLVGSMIRSLHNDVQFVI